MYKIAICDDDPQFLEQIGKAAAEIMDANGLTSGVDYGIDSFAQPTPLREAFLKNKDSYQLLLLDIELPEQSGMELAGLLRDKQVDCSLIYITAYRDFVFDCFDSRPLYYLLKPVDTQKLSGIIWQDYRRRYQGARLCLKMDGKQLSLPHGDIYALESAQHKTKIWLCDSFLEWNGPLAALKPDLPAWCFCLCHNSFVVNFSHVSEIMRTDALMDNGKKIPISRRLYAQTLDQYFAFLKI